MGQVEEDSLIHLTRVSLDLPDTRSGWEQARDTFLDRPSETLAGIRDLIHSRAGDQPELLRSYLVSDEAARTKGGLPLRRNRIMPTRLGNVLRRYEDLAGARYGLDAIVVVPRLTVIVPPQHAAYLEDSREGLDLAVRMCLVSAMATSVAVAALATDGLWLLGALLPCAMAYISYLGAVAAAHEYGTALCVLVDLNRGALYQTLRRPLPRDLGSEKSSNHILNQVLAGGAISNQDAASVTFVDPAEQPRTEVPRETSGAACAARGAPADVESYLVGSWRMHRRSGILIGGRQANVNAAPNFDPLASATTDQFFLAAVDSQVTSRLKSGSLATVCWLASAFALLGRTVWSEHVEGRRPLEDRAAERCGSLFRRY
jgi:predicted outer membrane lipoprotein